jgi:hypothetical protein
MSASERDSGEFLGQEFLTWLWYRGEIDQWTIWFAADSRMSYGIDEFLVLEPDDPTSCRNRLSGPVPVNSPEAQIGLREGKKVTAARLILVYEQREWSVTWHAENLQFSSLKLMKPTSVHPQERFLELAEDLEIVSDLLDRVYAQFLSIRLSEKWEAEELPAIRKWIQDKRLA